MRLLIVALLIGIVAGCSPDPRPEGPAVPSDTLPPLLQLPVEEEPAVSDSGAVYPGPELPELLARESERDTQGNLAILNELNPPARVDEVPYVNRHDPRQTDTLRVLYYSGLSIVIYEVAASGREMMQEIEVTGGPYRTAEGLGIGSTRAEVEAVVGKPTAMEDVGSMYELYDSPDDPIPTILSVAYAGDRVRRMKWSFYVD